MNRLGQSTNPAETRFELLERSEFISVLEDALETVGASGRLVFIAGEAGVGKTALLGEFCAQVPSARVVWGACERLFSPRALGPFLDIAEGFGGELADVARSHPTAHELLAALVAELRRAPTVLVVEDVHWADEGTLDVLKLLARRLEGLPVLALVSFRDEQLGPRDQLRIVLGELVGIRGVERLHVPPLSLTAVQTLATPSGADANRLFEKTAGNPFFVTEALAAVDVEIPTTVRDAVLARVGHLGPAARRLLEAVAVVPSRAEVWLVEAIAGDDVGGLDSCVGSGMLRHELGFVSFRHELARMAVEEAIGPIRRRHLHGLVLNALTGSPPEAVDPARVAHHADAAGDAEAVVRYAVAAGERAAALSAHRQAAQQYALALRHQDRLSLQRRADLWERLSYEYYLTQELDEAISARRRALALHVAEADRIREGDDHRWLSRLAWFAGDRATAVREGRCAVELLEREPPGRELGMAYSNSAQLCTLAGDVSGAVEFGRQAIALADRLAETEIVVHALNNVGTAEAFARIPEGTAKVERSLALALEHGFEEHAVRAHTNLASALVVNREYAKAETQLEAGIAYAEEHDLDSWRTYMSGWMARLRFEQGRWNEAAECAAAVLRDPRVPAPSRITPVVVLGRLRARLGDSDPWVLLDEALELARETSELQRLGPVAAARAEARWLQGDMARIATETDKTLTLARDRDDRWVVGELCTWRRRAGLQEAVDVDAAAPPFALELGGQWHAAAQLWKEIGCPYEAALALAEIEEEPALREALTQFQSLGAVPAAGAAAQRLRARGARRIERGPRRSTVNNPRQLTSRQVEILALLAEHMTNAEIAARLFIAPKTVEHHVSALLGKLGVQSRRQAAAEAVRLGISQR